jgi:DNA polymerase-3 subunit delta
VLAYSCPVKLGSDSLAAHLARQLTHAYLVSGDEPLLVGEAADAIRQAARQAGHTDRQVFVAERGFDWNELQGESASLPLFAERRILEVRLPSGKPGDGADVLQSLVERSAPDTLLLVISAQLDRTSQQSAWVNAFERGGAWVPVWPIDVGRLPAWIAARMQRHGLQPAAGAAEFLAERVEGNLLAAQQEIDKLALLIGRGTVDVETLGSAIARSARYDVWKLQDAALRGEGERALRILSGLRSEGEEPTLILWALSHALRGVWNSARGGLPPQGPRLPSAVADAARRLKVARVAELVTEAAAADRAIKGLSDDDSWDALARLVARMAGVRGVPDFPRGQAA